MELLTPALRAALRANALASEGVGHDPVPVLKLFNPMSAATWLATELDADGKPRLHAVNKVDLLPARERDALRDAEHTVHVSALKGIGLTTLLDRIDQMLQEDPVSRIRLKVPQSEGKVLSALEARSRIFSRQYRDGVVELEAEAPESLLRRLRSFVVE